MSGRPDWLVPGAAVALLTENRMNDCGSIITTTVERVLKRDVVLANGTRLNADRLSINRGSWESPTVLVRADDPRLAKVRRANRIAKRLDALRSLADGRWTGLTAEQIRERAAEISAAADSLADALDEAAGVVR